MCGGLVTLGSFSSFLFYIASIYAIHMLFFLSSAYNHIINFFVNQ